ncbi:LysR substrate-binding domain-containing protein [Limoniibacter endophyticus]|uniref:Transcriptional regulator n=1 Tax=Limoniibacter endophyticus TaxID=1565040 RepID=A0A8J3DJ66_9HYPH|nr:LysR substrate-binding domain-containing protein [Limoniibacter endophyticus]GHC76949.1 transcriptional regulator [Limoniibacter endophyticus]
MANLSRSIPSPRALLVFEAAARHGSFTAAAVEFNVTQPSVSRSIAQLEEELGFRLFERHSKGLTVTREGQRLFNSVQESMTAVSETIKSIRKNAGKRSVTMSMSSSFATHWLIPRLGDFNEAFPNIDLRFELVSGVMREVTGDVDIATRIVEDDDPRYEIWDFAPEIIVPVCSPQYLARHGSIDETDNLSQQVFLHLTDHKRDQWKPFLGKTILETAEIGTWNQFSDYAVILQAATQGKGVALGWISVIASALNDRTLVLSSNKRKITGRTHRLIIPKNRTVPQGTRDICDWFQYEMSSDLKKLSV